MWHTFALKTLGLLLVNCSSDTLTEVYNAVAQLSDVQKKQLRYEFGMGTFIEMVEDEYAYRNPCKECKKEINLDSV